MFKLKINHRAALAVLCLAVASCNVPKIVETAPHGAAPATYSGSQDSTNSAAIQYREFFKDPYLLNLIDTALKNNQELMSTFQEIEIAKNDIAFRHGQIAPTVGVRAGAGVEKAGRYTSQGAGDASTEITPGREVPDPLTDLAVGLYADWEVDIWKKLHNAKKAAVVRYLSTVEGKNFVLTNMVGEVASSYYELQALDSKLAIVRQNIELQKNALEIVKAQKEAARVTELAVQKFRAEVLNSQSLEFETMQNIKETENHINLLLGRYPQEIPRDKG
ncbi:MAG: TolC family protein, partial [Sphingobacteriales bacterium]